MTMPKTTNHASKPRGDGVLPDAQYDEDVIYMVLAELDKRSAAFHRMIAEAAYFRAEKRGFETGHELDDWLAAEAEIDQRLQQAKLKAQVAE